MLLLSLLVCRNSGVPHVREGADKQKDSEGCCQTQPSPPDLVSGGFPQRYPSFYTKECHLSIYRKAVQVNQFRVTWHSWESWPKLSIIMIISNFSFLSLSGFTWLPCITTRTLTDHKRKHGKACPSSRSTFQRLWRESVAWNHIGPNRHSVSVQFFEFLTRNDLICSCKNLSHLNKNIKQNTV